MSQLVESIPYYGDFPASHTQVCIPFSSFALATGAPGAVTNYAAADVQIYKNGGATPRASAAGITVVTSLATLAGHNTLKIDLSDNSDAGFYAAGNEYQVAVGDITVDAQTVRSFVGCFSIERAGGTLAVVKTTYALLDTEIAAILLDVATLEERSMNITQTP